MKADKNIPELRFPEFDGEWKLKRISDLGKFVGGGTPESNHIEYWQGSIPWISSSDVYEGNILDVNITRFITEDAIDESATKRIPEYSVLIVSRVGIGKFAVNKLEICTSQDFTNLIPFSDNSFFLAYFFSARQNRFLRLSQGTSIKGFTGEDIGNLKFYIPPLSEQHKIASFLSSVDQRIHLLTQKKEKLEQYKKGIMQRIFSQQLRFKPALSEVEGDENGQAYPEWEETQFGSLYRFISTNSLSREKLNYELGLVKNIHYGDIHTKFKSHLIIDNELVPYINPDVDLEKINSDNFLMEGDLVIADASEDYFDIGKSIEICQLNGQLVLAGLHTLQARRKSNYPTIGYGGHMMKSNEVRTQIQRIAQGTKVLSIAANRLSDISIKIPCKAEQQKIASFLSSLDQKITFVAQQIELTRKWKQGLLQKMFV